MSSHSEHGALTWAVFTNFRVQFSIGISAEWENLGFLQIPRSGAIASVHCQQEFAAM